MMTLATRHVKAPHVRASSVRAPLGRALWALWALTLVSACAKPKPDEPPLQTRQTPGLQAPDPEALALQAAERAAEQALADVQVTTAQADALGRLMGQRAQAAALDIQQARPKGIEALLQDKAARGPRDLVITAVGDVSQPTDSWSDLTLRLKGQVFEPTKALLDSGDLVFMNLENPISDLKPKVKKEFSFTSAPDRLDWYLEAGFNLFSLSNNHIGDADQPGIDDTLRHLRQKTQALGVQAWWAGAGSTYEEAEAPVYIELPQKNLRIAYFSTGISRSPNVSKFWSASLIKRIKEADQKADLVIVSVHAGMEYVHLPEEALVKTYRSWVDAGADVVIGHHPHVIRPVEAYRDAIIVHSLGNYVFASRTQRHRQLGAKMYGLVARVVIQDAKVAGVELTPTWVNNSEDWVLPSGERMKNSSFVPQLITGKFADAFFEDFLAWTADSGFALPERTGDTCVLRLPAPPSTAPAASPQSGLTAQQAKAIKEPPRGKKGQKLKKGQRPAASKASKSSKKTSAKRPQPARGRR